MPCNRLLRAQHHAWAWYALKCLNDAAPGPTRKQVTENA